MNMTVWLGQVVVMVILVGGSFVLGLSAGDMKRGKR